jgi:hypothetical protein
MRERGLGRGGISKLWVAKIRTLLFLTAMAPVLLAFALLMVCSLILVSPLMIYAGIRGKHLKDPRKNTHNLETST